MANKKKKWIHFRHKVTWWLFKPPVWLITKLKYRVSLPRFSRRRGEQFLILMNHQTPVDQFLIGFTFRGPVYFLGTEDIFSKGFISTLLRHFLAPIPIKKQTADISAVMNCLRVAKEGGTIALAPEGNRTFTGRTEYMNPAVAMLARKLSLPIALYRIEGGYAKQPRWANTVRRGKMRAYVSRVIEPDEIKSMTDDELYTAIREGLYVDDRTETGAFRHARRAEYLERALYTCPFCGLSDMHSKKNTLRCGKCGREFVYTEHGTFEGVGFDAPYKTVADWYDYQCAYVGARENIPETDTPLYTDEVSFSEVIVYKKKKKLAKRVTAALYHDRIVLSGKGREDVTFLFDDVSAVTALGRTKINIYKDKEVYQLAGGKRFSGLKYVNLHYRYKNMDKEGYDGKFLGL